VRLTEQIAIPVVEAEDLFDDFPTNTRCSSATSTPARAASRAPTSWSTSAPRCRRRRRSSRRVPRSSTSGIDPDVIGRVVPTDVGMVADVKEAAIDLHDAIASMADVEPARQDPRARFPAVKAFSARVAPRRRGDARPLEPGAAQLGARDRRARALLDKDAILVPELAQNTWSNQPWRWEAQFTFAPGDKSKIGRTTGSALGWASARRSASSSRVADRQVVALQGDGGFMFAQAESLWTMARYEVPLIVVILNNRSYNGPAQQDPDDRWPAGAGRQGHDLLSRQPRRRLRQGRGRLRRARRDRRQARTGRARHSSRVQARARGVHISSTP